MALMTSVATVVETDEFNNQTIVGYIHRDIDPFSENEY
jgi:hypothetical protein